MLPRVRNKEKAMNAKRFFTSLVLVLMAMMMVFPILMTFFFSFYSPADVMHIMGTGNKYDETFMETRIDLRMLSLEQYRHVFTEKAGILQYYRNSIFYTVVILACQAVIVPALSYALARFCFPGRDLLSFLVVMLLLLPFQVTMVPMVLVLRRIGLMDTVWAMILPSIASPFYIFLLRQHMIRIPNELFEAAQIDGAGTIRCFLHIAIPVSKSILMAVIALSFTDCWNMVDQPLVFLPNRSDLHPLSVVFNQLARRSTGMEFAGAALYILPALLIYVMFQKNMMVSIQLSDIK